MRFKLKILRRFNRLESVGIVPGVLVRRDTVLPRVPLQNVGDCLVCHEPLMVAIGQQIRFHKECRKEGRRRFGRATHVIEVDKKGVPKK